ncbi:MAG: hypothetical protein LLG01_13120 [Planctomycetaceae bacterium]|nr:hypothetical protein [Planctomycetaceae bacterium]
MSGDLQHPLTGRVVFLTRDRALVGREPAAWRAVYVPTAYEAAAELLAGPTAALVIDLRALSGVHLRLLEIARQNGAALIATGAPRLPVIAHALNGTLIVQRGELTAAIEAALSRRANEPPPTGAAVPSLIEVALAGPDGKPIDLSAAAWDNPLPMEPPPAQAQPPAAAAPPETAAPQRPAQPPADGQGVYRSDRGLDAARDAALLTAAELSALLEGPL